MLDKPPQLRSFWQQYRTSIIVLSCLVLIDVVMSLVNILGWPIFADEAIYIRWAQVMRAEPTLRFLPLTDGKQPLFMWIIIPFFKIISDPLLAGRVVSMSTGISSMIGMYFLGTFLFKQPKHGLVAATLYTLVPYTFFFDRFALVDSMLCMFFIWACVLALKNVKQPRLDLAMLTGVAMGMAWLTKSPAIYLFVIVPTVAFMHTQDFLKKKWRIIQWAITCGISFFIALGMYNILRLGPEFHQIGLRNTDYILSISEVLKNPFTAFVPNLSDWVSFYWYLLTPGILLLALWGLYKLLPSRLSTVIWLLIWIFVPTVSQLFFAKTLTARYLLYTIPPLLLLATYGFTNAYVAKKPVIKIGLFFIFIHLLIIDVLIMIAPLQVPLPRRERSGYLEEWTAGWGLRDMAAFLKTETGDQSVIVGTEGFFGTTPDGLQIYFNTDPRVKIIGQSHLLDAVPSGLYDALEENRVFLVINDERFHVDDPTAHGLKLIQAHPKALRPDGTRQTFQLFEVISKPGN